MNSASNFIYRGSSTLQTSIALSGRTYGNFTIESSSGTWTPSASAGAAALVINGSLNVGGTGAGTVLYNQSGATMATTVVGDISIKASCTYTPPTGTFTISGSITNAGTMTFNSSASLIFDGNTTLSGATLVSFANGFTVNANKTFANSQNGNIVPAGKTATINGTFQVNQGSWTGTTGTYTYGAAGTLIFNNTSGPYGSIDNTHLYWPASNGPFNVTVQNGGGITMGVARTVGGKFLLVSGTNAVQGTALTLNGTVQINGGNFQATPTYGASSTLIYNTTYGTSNEWTAGASNTVAAGSGIPANVTVQTGTLTLGGGRGIPGNLTIASGAGLILNATSGDLYIGGNLSNSGSTWTNNTRAVFFVLGNTQTITSTSNPQYFDYLVLDKTGGSVQLNSTNVSVNTASGNVVQILNSGSLDLNGYTLALNNSGGGIYVNGASTITSTATGGKLDINQYKFVANNAGTGSLLIGANVTVNMNVNGNFDFGKSGSTYITTLNGTLSINSTTSCFVNTNPPIYGSGAKLVYNSGGSYGRGLEWSSAGGAGYPYNLQISGNTTLNVNNGANVFRQIAGNLTVDIGSCQCESPP